MTNGASGKPGEGEQAPKYQEVPVSRAETMAAFNSVDPDEKRKSRSFSLSQECLARARNAARWGPARYLNMVERGEEIDMSEVPDNVSVLVELAIWAEVIRLEKLLNGGDPFPEAPERLPTGPGGAGAARLRLPRGPRKKAAEDDDTEKND